MRGELIFSFLPFSPFPPSSSPVGVPAKTGGMLDGREGKDYKTLKVFCITTLLLLFPLARSYQVSSASAVSSAVSTPHVFIPLSLSLPQNNRLLSPPPLQLPHCLAAAEKEKERETPIHLATLYQLPKKAI